MLSSNPSLVYSLPRRWSGGTFCWRRYDRALKPWLGSCCHHCKALLLWCHHYKHCGDHRRVMRYCSATRRRWNRWSSCWRPEDADAVRPDWCRSDCAIDDCCWPDDCCSNFYYTVRPRLHLHPFPATQCNRIIKAYNQWRRAKRSGQVATPSLSFQLCENLFVGKFPSKYAKFEVWRLKNSRFGET